MAIAAVVLIATLLAGPVARFAATSAQWLDYPYPRAGSEGLILYESLLVKHGGDLYAPITPERFISGPYPPLYYWLAAAVLPADLPDFSAPGNIRSIFLPGRIISLIAALVAAFIVPLVVIFEGGYGFAQRKRRRIFWLAVAGGVIGGALLLTLPQVTVWATRFRGDMLMLALTVCGLACIAFGVRDKPEAATGTTSKAQGAKYSTPAMVAGAIFFALAFYTKQTALAGPVASALFLLLRSWKLGLKWCVFMGVAVLLPFSALDIASGHWFYLKMVSYHSLPLRESTLARLLQFAFLEDQWPLVLLAALYLVFRLVEWWQHKRQHTKLETPALIPLFVLVALFMLPTGAVVGADHNHLLVPGLAVCLAVGALAAKLLTAGAEERDEIEGNPTVEPGKRTDKLLLGGGALATFLLLAIYALATSAPSSWYDPDLQLPGNATQEQMRQIVNNARQNPGALLFSDDPGITALAGKETPYDDPFTMTALAAQNRWDESAFREMLRTGKFSLIVLSCNVPEAPDTCRSDTLSPGVKDAIKTGYKIQYRDVLFTYIPNGQK